MITKCCYPTYAAALVRRWLAPWLAGELSSPRPDAALERLQKLDKPLLLLHGRQDMTFPVGLAEQAAQLSPTAHAAIIENAGHMTHADQPGTWLSCVRGFLE